MNLQDVLALLVVGGAVAYSFRFVRRVMKGDCGCGAGKACAARGDGKGRSRALVRTPLINLNRSVESPSAPIASRQDFAATADRRG